MQTGRKLDQAVSRILMRQRVAFTAQFVICIGVMAAAGCALREPFPPPRGDYGDPGEHISAMVELLSAAHADASQATGAATVEEIKQHADRVYSYVWGESSGLIGKSGAANMPGWKTRWQVTYTDFDPEFGKRYGSAPPLVTDPAKLGIVGRGRYVRRKLTEDSATRSRDAESAISVARLVEALNNVIGWMRIDDGVTKAERQPRVDLTYQWDAPKAFWQSTSDTGWLFEVEAQALNILKTDYHGDAASARLHARGLVELIEKCRDGVDATGDGLVSAVRMEGGLLAVKQAAREAGLL